MSHQAALEISQRVVDLLAGSDKSDNVCIHAHYLQVTIIIYW